MEKVKGTDQCHRCYRYVWLAGRPLCTGKAGEDLGLKKIEGWTASPCKKFLAFPWENSTGK